MTWSFTGRRVVKELAVLDLTPANEPPVLLHTPAERDLLALLGAYGGRQLQLRQIALHLRMVHLHRQAEKLKPRSMARCLRRFTTSYLGSNGGTQRVRERVAVSRSERGGSTLLQKASIARRSQWVGAQVRRQKPESGRRLIFLIFFEF